MTTPFQPLGDTVSIALSASSQALALTDAAGVSATIVLTNLGTQNAFFKVGSSGVTVTATNGMPLASGQRLQVGKGEATHVAVIGAAGSTIYATTGIGSLNS